jgi:6-pyruvoyltetrahydropterin/6-carboxytetrahydropterin synthase
MLSKHAKKCRFPHGHSRKVEYVIESETLDQNDMVCDFSVIKTATADILEQFDHSMCMNTKDPQYRTMKEDNGERVIGFDCDPTTEVMAKTLFDAWNHSSKLVSVKVWETSSSWAEFIR